MEITKELTQDTCEAYLAGFNDLSISKELTKDTAEAYLSGIVDRESVKPNFAEAAIAAEPKKRRGRPPKQKVV